MNYANLKICKGRNEDSRTFTATVNGEPISGTIIKGWSRIGGWGWEAAINGQSDTGGAWMSPTMKEAISRAVAARVCGGVA